MTKEISFKEISLNQDNYNFTYFELSAIKNSLEQTIDILQRLETGSWDDEAKEYINAHISANEKVLHMLKKLTK